MVSDLLMAYPTPQNLHIVPTHRASDGLALSSRNAYLSPAERTVAPVLYKALKEAEAGWKEGLGRSECLARAIATIDAVQVEDIAKRLDYIEMNDPSTFEVVSESMRFGSGAVILSGALWVGKTRLIDNIILGDL